MLNKAIIIATKAHEGQLDKAGEPYILHPLRVMLSLGHVREREKERIIAVLHDVIEDTPITLNDLRLAGFSDEIVSVIDILTRKKHETYDEYIDRITRNKTASRVKLADLADNMDISRIKDPTNKDLERIKKYKAAERKINQALWEVI